MTGCCSQAPPLHLHLYEVWRYQPRPPKSRVHATPPPSNSGRSWGAGGWESASSCQIAQGHQGTTGRRCAGLLWCRLRWEPIAGEPCWGQRSTRRHLIEKEIYCLLFFFNRCLNTLKYSLKMFSVSAWMWLDSYALALALGLEHWSHYGLSFYWIFLKLMVVFLYV